MKQTLVLLGVILALIPQTLQAQWRIGADAGASYDLYSIDKQYMTDYIYAGFVGEEDKTPVYGYIPTEVVFSLDGKILESTGITPDIYLPMDVDTWKATGKDNQLERALQLIGGRKLYSAGYQQYPRINLPFFR